MNLTYYKLLCIFCIINSLDCKKYGKHKPHRYYHPPREHYRDSHVMVHSYKELDFPVSNEKHQHHIRHQHDEIPWPVKKEAVIEGDLILGGLMMVHEREDSVTCGPIMPQGGIQALEAMLYTLNRLNHSPDTILPNISLGAHILDDCDKDTYGLEMAVDFIKGE
ncbi:hypothetical protein NQ317_017278 [Molorchus minor]|uniref:Receptor ligand binding region domain-containing protein n=1 Tax=Molorchus minor TaxID=1323400 RepID=A0ABQ9JUA7_9CUCU|nr:hypothetical protein NQ317_017278 [Molorchus minor]